VQTKLMHQSQKQSQTDAQQGGRVLIDWNRSNSPGDKWTGKETNKVGAARFKTTEKRHDLLKTCCDVATNLPKTVETAFAEPAPTHG
jgi:hypothetical protein